jgi:hypothetical protein
VRSVVVLIAMSQKWKDSSSCRSGEISSGVDRNVSEVQSQFILNWLCTSETFLSTPLLISPDLQDRLCLYFWDIDINTTTDLTWSTISTFFVLLRPFYQHHYWSHLIYKMNCLSTSETLLSTTLLISPDLQDRLSLYFWDIAINTTTDLT